MTNQASLEETVGRQRRGVSDDFDALFIRDHLYAWKEGAKSWHELPAQLRALTFTVYLAERSNE